MQALMGAVREACSPTLWSRGVQLHRAGMVLGQRRRGDEVEVRVGTLGSSGVAYTVLLDVDGEDWSCDCNGPADADADSDACAHVAAAVIGLRHAPPSPVDAAVGAGLGSIPHVAYALSRQPGGLALRRFLVQDGQRQPVDSLSQIYRGTAPAQSRFALTACDHAVEQALRGQRQGALPAALAAEVLQALIDSEHVTLDDRPIRVATAEPQFILRLSRRQGALWVQAVPHARADERFANGVVRRADVLLALCPVALPPPQLAALRAGHMVPEARLAHFIEHLLPRLKAALPLQEGSDALPQAVEMAPTLHIVTQGPDASREVPMDGFWTVTTVEYRDARGRPCGRLEGDALSYLGGPYPRRQRAAEAQLQAEAAVLGLRPGPRQLFLNASAIAMADKLAASGLLDGRQMAAALPFCSRHGLTPQIHWQDGSLDVQFHVAATSAGAAGTASCAAVLRAWECNSSLVQLSDGRFAPMPSDFLARHGEALRDLLAARGAEGRLPAAARLVAAQWFDDLEQPVPADLAPLLAAFGEGGQLPSVALPAHLQGVLRPYQQQGVDWLCALRDAGLGGLLADDMGLGKTLQAACSFVRGRPTLVVAPTSVLPNWAAELRRFRPDLQVATYHGARRRWQQADVVLTTYGLLRLDLSTLQATEWNLIVLDEAQTIKNPASQVAQAARQLVGQARLALCGTPMENHLEELWSHFQFLNPGHLGSLAEFTQRYVRPMQDGVAGAAARLQRRIRPFFLRRKKTEVARDLPPRTEQVRSCVLSARERALYDTVRAATVPSVLRQLAAGGNIMQALEALLRLRQACCHPNLVPGSHGDPQVPSAKVEALLRALGEITETGHKAIVFSQWTGFLDLIEPALRAQQLAWLRLDGSTVKRQAVVEAFQAPDGPPVFLISLKAGGTGLNLTAADHVFLMDPWWNPAVEDQAADRAHRIGQTRPVFIHKMIAQDTVEERIVALQASKRQAVAAALGGIDKGAQLSRDDLADLLT